MSMRLHAHFTVPLHIIECCIPASPLTQWFHFFEIFLNYKQPKTEQKEQPKSDEKPKTEQKEQPKEEKKDTKKVTKAKKKNGGNDE